MIPDSIVQIFAADQMKVFSEVSMAISKFEMAIFEPEMAIFRIFLTFEKQEGIK